MFQINFGAYWMEVILYNWPWQKIFSVSIFLGALYGKSFEFLYDDNLWRFLLYVYPFLHQHDLVAGFYFLLILSSINMIEL